MTKVKKNNTGLVLAEMQTNDVISQLEQQLSKLKGPSESTLDVTIEGMKIKEMTNVLELLELRGGVIKMHTVLKEQATEVSKKLQIKMPYVVTDKDIEQQINAIDQQILILSTSTKIKNLEDAIKKLKELRSEKEKEAAREAERLKGVEEALNLISLNVD